MYDSYQYQKDAMRTNDNKSHERMLDNSIDLMQKYVINTFQLANACLGLSGEVGEFNDEVKKIIFHNKEFDKETLLLELGDILWYIALACETLHISMDMLMASNIGKLRSRYPVGFDTDRSNNREV